MDKSLIEKYKAEMMGMYRTARKTAIPTVTQTEMPVTPPVFVQPDSDSGGLIVVVTAVRSLYPVENARVTVFSGDMQNRETVAEDLTDQSGRTEKFTLKTPAKSLSLNSQNTEIPYSVYGVEIKAEGYADTVFLNVPIFSGVTSVQRVNLTLLETLGQDKGPFVFDESQQYTLSNEEE